MKVLKRGDKNLKKTMYRANCCNCDSVLEFEEHEVKCLTYCDGLFCDFELECPVCNEVIYYVRW